MSVLWNIVQIGASLGFSFVFVGVLVALWQAYKKWSPRWDYRRAENDPETKYRAMKKKKKEGKE
jgi:hypothetical protein